MGTITMNPVAIGLLMLLAIVAIVTVILFVTRKKPVVDHTETSVCTPTDDEKAAAGGEGVLTFIHNASGNCVANTCVEGYTLGDGICSKAEEVKTTCLEEYDPSKTYPVVDGNTDNYSNYCSHATRAECKEAFCSSDKFKSKCADQCAV